MAPVLEPEFFFMLSHAIFNLMLPYFSCTAFHANTSVSVYNRVFITQVYIM